MFEATGWVLDEKQNGDDEESLFLAYTYPKTMEAVNRHPSMSVSSSQENGAAPIKYKSALIRRFDFSSQLQCMSVICKNDYDRGAYKAFVKGSPEKISEICRRETLPRDFNSVLASYTREGFRVIALSYKEMPGLTFRSAQTVERSEVESDVIFLGLLVMENKMKPVTTGVIQTLLDCKVDTIMATGDNVLTAISVAG